MTDELRVDAVLLVEASLERQHAEHEIDGRADRFHAALAPCPNLRAHVLNGRDAGGLEPARRGQIEVGRIDTDENVGGQRLDAFAELAADP
jgi:hypothetical protein